MFINPFGGKGQGKRIYERKVAPLFTLASITTEIIGKAQSLCRSKFENDSDMVTREDFYCIKIFFFLAMLRSLQDLSSPTGD